MAIKKNRFRFGDFKLPKNFIILGVVSIVAVVIVVIIMMNINNPVKTSEQPVTTYEEPVTIYEQPITTYEQPITTYEQPVNTPAPTTTTPVPSTTTPAPTTTTPVPSTTTPAPTTTTPAPTVSPLYTQANIDTLNYINGIIYQYISNNWVLTLDATNIYPSIHFRDDFAYNNGYQLYIGNGTPYVVGYSDYTFSNLDYYRKVVDEINKFNQRNGSGLSIPYLA